uniref:ATP-binding cassette domain-containing protein n=1 Tax=Paractinoplanes polyasparticus TaxID=2856853 RepID=UPI001C862C00|nr:ATP-binding cassette domain-containing protein [Actinoplanes polyasparticus]
MTRRFLRDAYRRAHVDPSELGVDDARAAGLDVSAEADRFAALVQKYGLARSLPVHFRGPYTRYALTGAVLVVTAAAVPPAITAAVTQTTDSAPGQFRALTTVSLLIVVFSIVRWLMTWQVRHLVLHTTLLTQRLVFRRLQLVDPQWLAASGKSTSSYLMAWPDQISQLVFAVEFVIYSALAAVLAVQLVAAFGWVGVLVMLLVAAITVGLRPLGVATVRTGMRYLDLDHARSQLVDDMARQRRQIHRYSLTTAFLAAVTRVRRPQLHVLRRRAYLAGAYDAALDALPVVFAAALIVAVQINSGLVASAQLAGILVASRLIVGAISENLATIRVVQSGTAAARGIDSLLRDAPSVHASASVAGSLPGTVVLARGSTELTVRPGQRVAVIGADSSRLLRSIVVPDSAPDGFRSRHTGTAQWVGRDHRPFDGAIGHVTTLWDTDPDDSRYVFALQRTGLDRELAARPSGDADNLSSSGRILSDGQSVRLALAQALYGRGDIYLLDDVFAPLDALNADTVATNLFDGGTSTWIFSAARPELLRHADIVVIATGGTLRATTPQELITTGAASEAVLDADATARLDAALAAEPNITPGAVPEAGEQYRQADLTDRSVVTASLDTHAAEPQNSSTAARLFQMIFGLRWSTVMIMAAVAAVLGELYLASNNGANGRSAAHAAAVYSVVAATVATAYLVRHLISYRGSVTAVDGLHHKALAHVLRRDDTTDPAAIGGRIGRDFTTAETQAPRVLSLIAVGVAALALSITVVAAGDPITLIPSGLLCAGLGAAYLRSRQATKAATQLAGAARAPSVNFAVAAIGYLGFHINDRVRTAVSHRFDELTAIRAGAGHRLQWVRLRLLLQVELVGAGFFVASAWAAPLTTSVISPAVLLYIAYSLTQQVVTVVERAQSGEIASRQVSRILALLGGRTPSRTELVHAAADIAAPAAAGPATVTLAHVVVETVGDSRMTAEVTLTCPPGSTTWINGPSGIGKSTLLDTIAGLRPPRSGHVIVESVSGTATTLLVGSDLPAMAITVGTLFNDSLGALEEVYAIAGRSAPHPDTTVTDLDHRDRQLTALARALAVQPSLLLVDEATSTLEAPLERNLLARLSAVGTTLMVVSHRPDNEDLADTVLTLTGSTAAIRSPATRMKHPS